MNPHMDNETQGKTACDAKSMISAEALKAIRRLNRNTTWVATGLLGSVIFATLMVALQDRQPEAVDTSDAATQFKNVDLSEKRATGEITSGQVTSVDHAFTEVSPQENPSTRTGVAAPAPTPGLGSAPEIKRQDVQVQVHATSWSPAHRPYYSARVIRRQISNARHRSSVRPRIANVERRLVALWRQSLVRSEKVGYTAETNH
jgi:hypothetical protein